MYWNMQNFGTNPPLQSSCNCPEHLCPDSRPMVLICRAELYQEYKSRPMLPPPFILISLVVRVLQDLFDMVRGRGCCRFHHLFQSARHDNIAKQERFKLERFSEFYTERFLTKVCMQCYSEILLNSRSVDGRSWAAD